MSAPAAPVANGCSPVEDGPAADAPDLDSPSQAGPDALSLAGALARTAGLPEPASATPLPGGRNNRVYRLDGPGGLGGPMLLKRYFSHPLDTRNRLGTEYAFLRYANSLGAPQVPAPLAMDAKAGAALYGFVAGRPFTAGDVAPSHVAEALDFTELLQSGCQTAQARALSGASESCFSFEAHLDCVTRRMTRFGAMAVSCEEDETACRFVRERLIPVWERVHERTRRMAERMAGAELSRELPEAFRVISPSDFGFHNALSAPSGRTMFLDFEYAGWDDPAKLACDFFLQPRVPVPAELLGEFVERLARLAGAGHDLARRVDILLPVHRVKWCCIVLGEFLAVSSSRRTFAARGAASRETKRAQLAKAAALLEPLEP